MSASVGGVLLAGLFAMLGVWWWPTKAVAKAQHSAAFPAEARSADSATTLDVADAMDLIALGLESGVAVTACLERVAEECGPTIAAHLRQVAAALQWGVDPRIAWDGVPDAWGAATTALALAERAGVPPADYLRDAARRVREAEHHRVEIAGAKVAVRLVLPLGLCFLPAFVLLTVVPVVVAMAASLLRSGA